MYIFICLSEYIYVVFKFNYAGAYVHVDIYGQGERKRRAYTSGFNNTIHN